MTVWINLDYASLLYAVDQTTLAGGEPGDAWDHACWWVERCFGHTTKIGALNLAWRDVTGVSLFNWAVWKLAVAEAIG